MLFYTPKINIHSNLLVSEMIRNQWNQKGEQEENWMNLWNFLFPTIIDKVSRTNPIDRFLLNISTTTLRLVKKVACLYFILT